jgi:hypothetical protein
MVTALGSRDWGEHDRGRNMRIRLVRWLDGWCSVPCSIKHTKPLEVSRRSEIYAVTLSFMSRVLSLDWALMALWRRSIFQNCPSLLIMRSFKKLVLHTLYQLLWGCVAVASSLRSHYGVQRHEAVIDTQSWDSTQLLAEVSVDKWIIPHFKLLSIFRPWLSVKPRNKMGLVHDASIPCSILFSVTGNIGYLLVVVH